MAYSLTDTGVRISSGRGANAVAIEVSFEKIESWARKMKIDTSAVFKRSFGRACSGLKKQLQVVMREGGGANGVPKFKDWTDFTRQMRERQTWRQHKSMGGVLADPRRIVAFRRNGYQVVGWPDALAAFAIKFQDGYDATSERQLSDSSWRHWVHAKMRVDDVPNVYAVRRREVIEPHFREHVAENLDKWANAIYFKDLARAMRKAGAIAV